MILDGGSVSRVRTLARPYVEGRERRVDREAEGLITPRESRFREEIGQFRKYVRAVSVLLSRDGREGGR